MVQALDTARLLLKPLALSDAYQIQIIFPKWEIVRLMSDTIPWPYPNDGALAYCRDVALPAIARGEQWHWTLRMKDQARQVIGAIGLMTIENNNRGFWIGMPWQGRGLMTEASDAVTDFWFNELKFPVLRAPKAVENVASRRISEKSGMRIVATEERGYVSGRFLAEVWEITAEEWNTRRPRP